MFRPKPRVKSLAELNAWLEDQCVAMLAFKLAMGLLFSLGLFSATT
jgi:hypothetical protein